MQPQQPNQPTATAEVSLKIIARIRTEFPDKFGVPRQSGLVEALQGQIIFEPDFRNTDALRGLEDFSHIWLLWSFSQAIRQGWTPTVRPPRLGGNTRLGVFATRSPFRPNPIGLSSVKLERIDLHTPEGPVLHVRGADLMDNTPIYDIKPYLPFVDSRPDASGGFAAPLRDYALQVEIPQAVLRQIPSQRLDSLRAVLSQDPRPAYQQDPQRVYGMDFAGLRVKFTVSGNVLAVLSVEPC